MSIDSVDYKVYKYTTDAGSANHPSFDKGSTCSLSSLDSKSDRPISRTKSALASKVK